MQPKLIMTQLLTKVKENNKREASEYEPALNLINNAGDPQISQHQAKYQYPVITEQCNHLKTCFNLEYVRQELKTVGFFKCPACNSVILKEEQLIKDLRWYANEEFHELVQEVMVLDGQLFNRYYRNKRFTDFFTDKIIRQNITAMMTRFVEQENSVNSIILNSLQTDSQSQFRTGSNQIISFWAICLQDKVKVTIPVRIIGCKHKECYDLTSLLAYQKENAKQQEAKKQSALQTQQQQQQLNSQEQDLDNFFYCAAEGCYQKLDVSNVQTMFTQLVIDRHLLNALKLSPPSSFKFVFNQTTLKIEHEVQRREGIAIDQAIYECFRKRKVADGQAVLINEYQQFEKQVQQQITNILQLSVAKDIEKKLQCQKYQQYQIKMQDQFTGYTVEYPVRCKHSDNSTSSYDLRSVIADFIYDKTFGSSTSLFVCKLCGQQQNQQIIRVQIQNQLYLDQNLFSRMFKDMSYQHTKTFNYEGKQYMRQEFYDKQKIEIEAYKKGLSQQGGIMTVEIKNLFCSKNQNTRISMPLLLKQCPKQSIVEFDTFYNELKQSEFDLEKKPLILCQCDTCNQNPITKIIGNIYYHEAFGKAFEAFRKTNSKEKSFKYDFGRDMLSNASTVIQGSTKITVEGRDGFIDLMNDEDYQNSFKVKQMGGHQHHFQILSMSQDVADGISVRHDASGAVGNLDEKKKEMNVYAQQNPQLKKWNFQVQSINLQLNNDLIKINKGQLGDTPTNPG